MTFIRSLQGFGHKGKRLIKRLLGPNYAVRRILSRELVEGEPEIALIPVLCTRDTDFLDVGANFGIYSFYAKNHSRHVYAVEPHPALTRHLRAILGNKGTVLAIGASDHAAIARLSIPVLDGNDIESRSSLQTNANPGFETREIDVPIAPIDDLGLTHVGVVKIDVEGHEFAALTGARRTLETCHPIAIVECEERHNPGGVERVFRFFADLDYKPYFIHRGQLRLGEEFAASRFQSLREAKPIGSARSSNLVNNFIFIHRDNDAALAHIRQFKFETRS